MALKNAFDNLATENALRKIISLLTFARDSNDRIRTTVDGGSISLYNRNSSTNMGGDVLPIPFANHTWNAQDARETQKIQMKLNADQIKRNRWTY